MQRSAAKTANLQCGATICAAPRRRRVDPPRLPRHRSGAVPTFLPHTHAQASLGDSGVIYPESRRKLLWDLLMTCLGMYYALHTPLSIAFGEHLDRTCVVAAASGGPRSAPGLNGLTPAPRSAPGLNGLTPPHGLRRD